MSRDRERLCDDALTRQPIVRWRKWLATRYSERVERTFEPV